MNFVLSCIVNPTVKQTPYSKGSLVVRRSVCPRKERQEWCWCLTMRLVGRKIIYRLRPLDVAGSTPSEVITLNNRLHGVAK